MFLLPPSSGTKQEQQVQTLFILFPTTYKAINFLDLTLVKDGFKLYTTIYTKPTDRNTSLTGGSFHPMPLTQGLLLKIRSSDEDFDTKSLERIFLVSGYPSKWIDCDCNKALERLRESLMKPVKKSDKNIISPLSGKIKSIIFKHCWILTSDHKVGNLFKHHSCKNLKDILVSADLKSHSKHKNR